MKIHDLQTAHYALERIRALERLRDEVAEREIDFVEGDRRRSLGRNQLDPTKIAAHREALVSASAAWFDGEIKRLKGELADMGIEVDCEDAA